MAENLHQDVDRFSARLSAIAINVICITYYNIMAIVLGGAADSHGLQESDLGFAASAFMGGLALINFGGFIWLRRYNWKHLVLAGNLMAAVSFVVPVFYFSFGTWLLCNLLAGLGSGISYGVSIASLGDTREPERNFALAYAGQTFLSAILIFLLPRLHIGLDIFGTGQSIVAALMTACVVLIVFVPRQGSKSGELHDMTPGQRNGLPQVALWMALGVLFLNVMAEGAVWAFLERIAVSSGHDTKFAATVIAISFFAAGAGSIIAAVISTRFGRARPFAVAVAVSITSVWLLWLAEMPAMYIAGVLLFAAAWNLGSPYRMALATSSDVSGRFSTFVPATQTLGAAIGPALGGLLVLNGSFVYVYIMSTIAWLFTIVLFFAAQKRLRAYSRRAQPGKLHNISKTRLAANNEVFPEGS